jgi:hypothetical protein
MTCETDEYNNIIAQLRFRYPQMTLRSDIPDGELFRVIFGTFNGKTGTRESNINQIERHVDSQKLTKNNGSWWTSKDINLLLAMLEHCVKVKSGRRTRKMRRNRNKTRRYRKNR